MWKKLKCDKCGSNINAKFNDSVVSRESITSVLCESCANSSFMEENISLREELKELKEFQCRTIEAFKAIQGDVSYSQKVKLETAIYGSFSCPHKEEMERKEREWNNTCLGWSEEIDKLEKVVEAAKGIRRSLLIYHTKPETCDCVVCWFDNVLLKAQKDK